MERRPTMPALAVSGADLAQDAAMSGYLTIPSSGGLFRSPAPKFYVLKEVWLLATYNKHTDAHATHLEVVDDKVARLVAPTNAGATAQHASMTPKLRKMLGVSEAEEKRFVGGVDSRCTRFVLENQLDPTSAPVQFQAETPGQADAWVEAIAKANPARRRERRPSRHASFLRKMEDLNDEHDILQQDLERVVGLLKAALAEKAVLKKAIQQERRQVSEALQQLRQVMDKLGMELPQGLRPRVESSVSAPGTEPSARPHTEYKFFVSGGQGRPPSAVAVDAAAHALQPGAAGRADDASFDGAGAGAGALGAGAGVLGAGAGALGAGVGAGAGAGAGSSDGGSGGSGSRGSRGGGGRSGAGSDGGGASGTRPQNPLPLLEAVAQEFTMASSEGLIVSRQAVDDAVAAARQDEREALSRVSDHDMHVERLTQFFSMYDPKRVDEVESLLEAFDGRIPVLYGRLERMYHRSLRNTDAAVVSAGPRGRNRPALLSLPSSLPRPSSGSASELNLGLTIAAVGASSRPHATSDPDPRLGTSVEYLSAGRRDLLSDDGGSLDRTFSTTRRMRTNTNSMPEAAPPPWVPDTSVQSCQVCCKQFSVRRRRHHCRACGRLVCASCAPASAQKPIPEFGYWEPVRHCKDCYLLKA